MFKKKKKKKTSNLEKGTKQSPLTQPPHGAADPSVCFLGD